MPIRDSLSPHPTPRRGAADRAGGAHTVRATAAVGPGGRGREGRGMRGEKSERGCTQILDKSSTNYAKVPTKVLNKAPTYYTKAQLLYKAPTKAY